MVRILSAALLALIAIPLLAGCGLLEQDPPPTDARVELAGSEAYTTTLVISTDFDAIPPSAEDGSSESTIIVHSSDTLLVTPPFDETYDIAGPRRFLVRAFREAPGEDQVRLQVYIDNDLKYDYDSSLTEHADSMLQYMYNFAGTQ